MSPRHITISECAPFYQGYIDHLWDNSSITEALLLSEYQLTKLIEKIPKEMGEYRYAPAKWSIKEVLIHLMDTERIFANRALRIARGDQTPLPGFDQDDYIPTCGAARRSLSEIMEERNALRLSTILLYKGLDESALMRLGNANGHPVSTRALGYILAGHDIHHIEVINDRYL